jgi:hypothetical protein
LSENGKGNPEVIEFEELEAEDSTPTSSKEEQLATFLKDKLSEEDFGAAAKILGVETEDLSNAELLEKLTELLQGKKEEAPEEEEEKEMADYKTYMNNAWQKVSPWRNVKQSTRKSTLRLRKRKQQHQRNSRNQKTKKTPSSLNSTPVLRS